MKKKKKNKEFSEEEIEIFNPEDKISPIVQIPIKDLIAMPENANELTEKMFSALTASINESGLSRQPILVSPIGDGKYEVVSGNHRMESAKLLGWEKVPCIVEEFKNPLLKKATSVKMNLIHGSPNSAKFTQMFNDIQHEYGEEQAKELMGVADEKLFKQIYLEIRKSLPSKEMKKEFAEKAKDVQSIDSLTSILQNMLDKFGSTIDNSFMVFSFGGKTHVYIELDNRLKVRLNKIVEKVTAFEINMTEFFNYLMQYSDSVFRKKYNIQKEVTEDALLEDELADSLVKDETPVYKKENRKGGYKKKKKSEKNDEI